MLFENVGHGLRQNFLALMTEIGERFGFGRHPRGPFVPKKDGQMQFAQKAVKKHCGREKDLTAKTNWP